MLSAALFGATRCTETQRGLGEQCLRAADCTSGFCAGQQCVAQPPLLDGSPSFDSGDAGAVADASDAVSDVRPRADTSMPPRDTGAPPKDGAPPTDSAKDGAGKDGAGLVDSGAQDARDAADGARPKDSAADDAPADAAAAG